MKKHLHLKYGAVAILLAVICYTCVDPIPFDRRQEADILVVDGKLNLQDSVQQLSLTRTAVIGRSARFPPEVGAQVILFENDQVVNDYSEAEPGVYKIFNFKPQIGRSYRVEITLANGRRYASEPDVMPQPVTLDSAFFRYVGNRELTLYARTPIPADYAPYLRWRIRHVYQVSDIACGGLDFNAGTCYYETPRLTDNQLVPLLDGGKLEPNSIVETAIVDVPIVDSIFGEVTFFTIFQQTLSLSAFEYWQKVNTLLTQTGSLFDAPPGQIRGNVYSLDDGNEPVLGLFYATSEDFTYVKTFPSDFSGLNIQPYCGIAGVPTSPFPFPQCCVCRFGIPRPAYWR